MTFCGEKTDSRRVFVDMEARLVSWCDGLAVSCGVPDSAGRECGDFYAIQFLACDSKYVLAGIMPFRGEERINICLPVADEVALGWKPIDWWYYVRKFSDLFTAEELGRRRSLGMPDIALAEIERLQRTSRTESGQESQLNDAESVDADSATGDIEGLVEEQKR
jgi:hypothetical protein